MKTFGIVAGVVFAGLLGIALIIGLWFWGSYNALVITSTQTDTAWASVQTEYQRRFDLVPNLVAATKGTMAQEQAVFGAIAEARTHYAGAESGSADQANAASQYQSALGRLLVIMENYPTLQSNATVMSFMAELSGTENRVQVGRDRYNQSVQTYNITIKQFPKNMIAGMFGYQFRLPFASDGGAEKVPAVNLDIPKK